MTKHAKVLLLPWATSAAHQLLMSHIALQQPSPQGVRILESAMEHLWHSGHSSAGPCGSEQWCPPAGRPWDSTVAGWLAERRHE